MSRVVYPARETVTEIRGEDAAEIILLNRELATA